IRLVETPLSPGLLRNPTSPRERGEVKSLRLRRLADLVLRLGQEIAGIMALVQLARRIARDAVDHAAASHCRALGDRIGPALHVLVILHRQEFARAIEQALGERAVPRPYRDVGDGIVAAG